MVSQQFKPEDIARRRRIDRNPVQRDLAALYAEVRGESDLVPKAEECTAHSPALSSVSASSPRRVTVQEYSHLPVAIDRNHASTKAWLNANRCRAGTKTRAVR